MEATARVRCSGSLHKISITKKGAVVLHDHNHHDTERAFTALGGEKCRCMEVLHAWKRKNRKDLPAPLRPVLDAVKEKKQEKKVFAGTDPMLSPIRARCESRVRMAAEAALDQCSYRRSQSSWAGGDHFTSAFIGVPDIAGSSERVRSGNGKWSGTDSYITVTIPLHWYRKVYLRGLAVVDEHFILDVLGEDKKGIHVLAGKQGRGFDVCPRPAVITPGGKLRWEKGAK